MQPVTAPSGLWFRRRARHRGRGRMALLEPHRNGSVEPVQQALTDWAVHRAHTWPRADCHRLEVYVSWKSLLNRGSESYQAEGPWL
jgi:hypothetical protein